MSNRTLRQLAAIHTQLRAATRAATAVRQECSDLRAVIARTPLRTMGYERESLRGREQALARREKAIADLRLREAVLLNEAVGKLPERREG